MARIKLYFERLRSNLDVLSKKAGGIEKIAAVLKDNAYGHGLEQFSKATSKLGVTRAVVRNAKEALSVEKDFSEIIVLSERASDFLKHKKIVFAINDMTTLKSTQEGVKIALKIDSGMHRNGILPQDFEQALFIVSQNRLSLHSVFTHFRSADEIDADFFWQKENFNEIKKRCKELSSRYDLPKIRFHSCNSAGLLRYGKFDEDFARIGIAMYGYCDLPKAFGDFGLKPVLELFAHKISQRELKVGQRVGYGGVFEAKQNTICSVYDVGYSDGLLRYDGKGELKTTDGSPILGRISMDSLSAESDKDELSIFNNANIWAKHFNTISYDILVKLNCNIQRDVV
jgi:alanine racemase